MTIEEMNRRREELGLTYKRISELSGVPLSTVQKVLGGITDSPRYSTMKALTDVLLYESRENSPLATYHYSDYILGEDVRRDSELYDLVSDVLPAYHTTAGSAEWRLRDGSKPMKTVEDYYSLADDKRVELIDGVFYDMATPSAEHQIIATQIFNAFSSYIMKNKGGCVPMIAPFDVQLMEDNINMVEPDVMIICDKQKIQENRVFGAPDLVVEIVSKTSGAYDRIKKLNKYLDSDVREYWIVDPILEEILVYEFEKDYMPSRYTLEDRVPVGIYSGKCHVDFGKVMATVRELLYD